MSESVPYIHPSLSFPWLSTASPKQLKLLWSSPATRSTQKSYMTNCRYLCVYACVCVSVRVWLCMYVYIYIYIYIYIDIYIYIYIYICIYINSIYIWKRPEQRGQRGQHKLVRACAIPDRVRANSQGDVDLGTHACYCRTGRTSVLSLRTVWVWESSLLDVEL